VDELEKKYYPWYEGQVRWLARITYPLQIFGMLCGIAASILTAVFTGEGAEITGTLRIILIVLPALGSAIAAFIVQAKLLERAQLREDGRRAMQFYIDECKQTLACTTDPKELSTYFTQLREKVNLIEESQSATFFSLVKGTK
jgi:hypothetical protein